MFKLLIVLCCLISLSVGYNVGVGIWDVTGPTAEVEMMGMGQFAQRAHGLHMRLRSRAFVFEDLEADTRVVYVTNNLCMTYGGIVQNVTAKLQDRFGPHKYTRENVMISGEHTHSGPAGYTYMTIYDLSTLGFHADNFNAIVDGIVQAIIMADESLQEGTIKINSGNLYNTSLSRSSYSYSFNPQDEQDMYEDNVDKLMTLLRIEDSTGKELGLLNWFAVHGTSMHNTNELVSGDNKGYAAYYVERMKNGANTPPGLGNFVAGFAQSNEGDVTPNVGGAFCPDNTPCGDTWHSTCTDEMGFETSAGCNGVGPGGEDDDFESTRIIGENQATFALNLYDSAVEVLQGPISYVHTFLNMSNIVVDASYTSTGQTGYTCSAALGDSFAGGTTDGPGDLNFIQGVNNTETNARWNELAYTLLSRPTQDIIDCQYPKPILINGGQLNFPAPWVATILPIQIFRVGQLFVIAVPGEFTTMSGRRLRSTVLNSLQDAGLADENSHVVISGLSNEYSHYITTFEEYQVQRYEGASTLYGPHTLAAYQQEFDRLVQMGLAQNITSLDGPAPPDLSYVKWCIGECTRGPDQHPHGEQYGSVESDVDPSYSTGSTASVSFWGGNPNHDFQTQETYLIVQRKLENGIFIPVYYDGDFETKMLWERKQELYNLITIQWDIPLDATPGTYQIIHYGSYKSPTGNINAYTGVSSEFQVTGQ